MKKVKEQKHSFLSDYESIKNELLDSLTHFHKKVTTRFEAQNMQVWSAMNKFRVYIDDHKDASFNLTKSSAALGNPILDTH